MGRIHNSLGDYPKALDFYQQYLAISQSIHNRYGEGIALNNIGFIYYNLGDYPKALELYQQSLIIRQAIGDPYGEGSVLSNIGSIYDSIGDYPKALDFYQQSLAISREIGDRNGQGISINNIGAVYDNLGDYAKALEFYQQALAIFEDLVDRRSQGEVLNNIGLIYHNLGNYSKALDLYHQALIIRQEIDDRRGESISLNNIGAIYYNLGDYSKALDYYQQSLTIVRDLDDRRNASVLLNNIGRIYDHLADYPKALDFYQQALAIRQAIIDRRGEGESLNNIGRIHFGLGNYPQALNFHHQALFIHQEIHNRYGEGVSLNNLGRTHVGLGDFTKALNFYQQSLAIRQEIGDREGQAETLGHIGSTLARQNQPELAIVFLKQSVNVYETIRGDLRVLETDLQTAYIDTIADTYRQLADLLLTADRIIEAQQVLDLLKVQELTDYFQDIQRSQTTTGIANRTPENAIQAGYSALLEQAVNLGTRLAELERIERPNRTPEQQDQIRDLRRQLEEITQSFTAFLASESVQARINELKQVAQEPVDLETFRTLKNDLAALDQGAVLLYPLVLEERLELVMVTPNTPPVNVTVPVSRAELNRTIAEYRAQLTRPGHPALAQAPAQQLYQWLIAPLETALAEAGAETIIYAPDGQLRYIPLAALYTGDQWLIEKYRINNITATSLNELTSNPTAQPELFAGAFSEGEYFVELIQSSFLGLEFAGIEVANLAALIPGTTALFNQAFNTDTIYDMNDYSVVHLATHAAFVPGAPENSFILFGDGTPVSINEVKNWDLSNVELVVLSACETGLGDELGNGVEVLGLGYQIQRAGAKAVMASLWRVNDGGTQVLMNLFYTALSQGNTKAEALRLAQMAMIRDSVEPTTGQPLSQIRNLEHPYYWAPFILIGNGL
jgi:CHAT domain-containing protein/Tfp pilus assembly protein PilF